MSEKRLALITGGAGCIGSELAAALLAKGWRVRVLDNLSTGRYAHIEPLIPNPDFRFLLGDVLDEPTILAAMAGADMTWHLTAKTDIKFIGQYDFDADYRQNLAATWNVIHAMLQRGVKRIAFSSSAAVYGEAEVLYENDQPAPISMYGATKLACEYLIRALSARAGVQAWMFRYCSIVSGKARTAGNMVIPDLIHKLRADPKRLPIYGDGNQTKPSLHVSECVDAMLYIVEHETAPVSVYNIGAPDAISVTRQAEIICEMMGVSPVFEYTGGAGGWPGDVPSFRMCVDKLARLGWRAKRTSEEAVRFAIKGLLESGE